MFGRALAMFLYHGTWQAEVTGGDVVEGEGLQIESRPRDFDRDSTRAVVNFLVFAGGSAKGKLGEGQALIVRRRRSLVCRKEGQPLRRIDEC